jgi:hypothetical protein
MVDYSTVDYPEESALDSPQKYHLTAINTISSTLESNSSSMPPKDVPDSFKLGKPNQFRAFSRHAYSYNKRQCFTNICCVSLCPVFIIIVSFTLQTLLQGLLMPRVDSNYQVLYCSDQPSINQQQWPIFNTQAAGITEQGADSYAGARRRVRHFNFLQRSIYVDLSSADSLNVYSALSLTGSSPCNFIR